ncbi:hypothetical protein T484DRAFT_1826855 [Baffinella frigidus]|nr:hypothetical protein T484DRAFT_1826855 [Cryptophyta sp. CCMP2293]
MAGRALFVALAAPLLLCNAWQAPLLAGRAPLLRQAGMGAMSPARQGAGLRLAGRPSLARSLLAQDTSLETATGLGKVEENPP